MKTELKSNVCLTCGANDALDIVEAETKQTFRGENLNVLTPVTVCRDCNFQFLGGGQIDELRRRTADAYRKKHKLLTSADIVSRRKALGDTQEEFAKRLKVGVASVKRWETWLVQDERNDQVIREETDYDLLAQRIAGIMRSIGKTPAIEAAFYKILEAEGKLIEGIGQLADRLATEPTTSWRELLMSPPTDLKHLSRTSGGAHLTDDFKIRCSHEPLADLRNRSTIAFKILMPGRSKVHAKEKFEEERNVVAAAA